MNLSPSREREALRAKLIEAYEAASPSEQLVLQVLSALCESVPRTAITTILSNPKVQVGGRRALSKDEIRNSLEHLAKSGLAETTTPSYNTSYWRCHELVMETAARHAQRAGRFDAIAEAAESAIPVEGRYGFHYFRNLEQIMRLIRVRLFQNDMDRLGPLLQRAHDSYSGAFRAGSPLNRLCNNPFDAVWFSKLPEKIQIEALWSILSESFDLLEPAEEAFAYLCRLNAERDYKESSGLFLVIGGRQLVLRGRFEEAEVLAQNRDELDLGLLRALLHLLRGRFDEAVEEYDEALSTIRKATKKRKVALYGHDGVFYALALIQSRDTARLKQAAEYLGRAVRDASTSFKPACAALLELVESYLGVPNGQNSKAPCYLWTADATPLDLLVKILCDYWRDSQDSGHLNGLLVAQHARAVEAGYDWMAAEMAALIARIQPKMTEYDAQATAFHEKAGTRSILDLLRRQETWELSLDALEHVAESTKVEPGGSDTRLTWHIELMGEHWRIDPRETKLLQSGRWSKGKAVSLKRLCTERDHFPYLTSQDIAVCSFISPEIERYGRYGSRTYYDLPARALLALVGHPMVFLGDGPRVEILKGEPELHVVKRSGHVLIELVPPLEAEQDVAVVKESHTRLKVIECAPEHRRIAGIIKKGLRVPLEHKTRVLESLARITSLITIHSDIGGGLENVPMAPEDSRPHIMLLPTGAGLRIQILVKPLAEGAAYYRPGTGGETVLAEVDGHPVQARRNLGAEKELAGQAVAACPTLAHATECESEWVVDEPEECLELLDELQQLGDTVILEWPQGQKLHISNRVSLGSLQLKIGSGKNWFEVTGQVLLDENRVLDMRQLLELLDEARGRFVPLGDGQFLALTKEFRKRLDELRSISETHGKGVRFHPLAAPAIENLLENAGSFKTDKAWKTQIARFRESQAFEPALPSTLRAELRDYQTEGYQWLARLARWGAGACLADDMGLGKTVQALTLILSHAAEGPAIVVAPTSVCMNWIAEAQKFAPTLNPILFGAGDRQATLDGLNPFDLMVCSYGLLYQEEEKLTAIRWRVAVLDEAQAIKNYATRRSQAAMNLQADFRIITTGTPIENHLGELWNLFRFINPGLLGSLEQFTRRFAAPIERRQDREARNRLKKVIQPFILRRLKEQVLEELPSRTEILLHVECSAEETAFYEALRQKAVEKIARTQGPPAQKHLMILAEIMRLRRACCNAQLVTPGIDIASSKLSVFLGLVDELIENRHKALVFSQFVDHLAILRKELDQRGVVYQYLDGSTPQRQRKISVDAFQAGEGDLFLISLKAGGLGLNLTAADYVIHMDPWWNPAVEDQASDRAHRIGQLRPVTIYRLVTKDTIESKIVDLHRHKRDLADSLLEGSDMAGKMSAEDLLALLREGL